MKKIYFFIIAAVLLFPFRMSAATANVYLDKANAVILFVYDSATDDYIDQHLRNTGDTPNVITFNPETQSTWNLEGTLYQVVRNGEVVEPVDCGDGSYDITGMQDGDELYIYSEKPANPNPELATATVYLDKANAVSLFLFDSATQDYTDVHLQKSGDEPNIIEFNPQTQSTWNIEGFFIQILRNDVQITPVDCGDGSYDITGMQDGDVLRIITQAPVATASVTIQYSGEGSQAISKINVAGSDVDFSAGSFAVNNGDQVLVYPKAEYDVSAAYDGEELSYIVASGCFAFNAKSGNTTLAIAASPKAGASFTFTIDNPEAVTVYQDASEWNEGIQINNIVTGEQTIELGATTPVFMVKPNEGYKVLSAKYKNEAGREYDMFYQSYAGWYFINVVNNDVVSINVTTEQEVVEDMEIVIYCDNVENLTGYFLRTADRKFPIDSDDDATKLHNGYQTLTITTKQSPVRLNLEFSELPENNVYLNNTLVSSLKVDDSDNSLWGDFAVANGDVLKIYTNGAPATYTVNFKLDGELTADDVEIVADLIKDVDVAAAYNCFEGTMLKICSDKELSIVVNGEAVESNEITVDDNTEVTLSLANSIEGIIANSMHGKIYNLQGIEVKGDNLPAGLYIINGKKQLITK